MEGSINTLQRRSLNVGHANISEAINAYRVINLLRILLLFLFTLKQLHFPLTKAVITSISGMASFLIDYHPVLLIALKHAKQLPRLARGSAAGREGWSHPPNAATPLLHVY